MKRDRMRFIAACHAMQAIIAKAPLFDLKWNVGHGEKATAWHKMDVMNAVATGAVEYADALLSKLDETDE